MRDTKKGKLDAGQLTNFRNRNQALLDEVTNTSSFKEISLEELQEFRKQLKGKNFYVLKLNKKFYLLPGKPQNYSANAHLCSICRRCIARPTSEGGCDKVYTMGDDKVMNNFPFVEVAIESPDKPNSEEGHLTTSFAVLECSYFEHA